ncbi:phospholipase D family protein [Vibrio sp. ZSDZ34]|jgi:putative cardiolipin synthase|uniref:Phospholipase D family protein n=1 Tax=Vibrio gelatinilyticus TaxID=2893468 RepID=A0A9X2AVX3_9VIBR|nr:phospholipase D family protein [Vibrio gelatinilyticus]MCJ2376795.1 phospholipase D family protein [Vibrio gelatinilyticus]
MRLPGTIRTLTLLLFASLLTGCVSSSIDATRYEKTKSYTIINEEPTKLSEYFQPQFAAQATGYKTGFRPLSKGHDALLARLAIIESAQSSIDVQYYIFRDDEAGNLLTWRLFEAAERGVRVRVLLDDMQKYDDNDLVRFSSHPNIQVRMFNPHHFRVARGLAMMSDFERLNHRMHNKSLTVDGVASIIGGRNIGNEYFSIQSNVEFADLDLLLLGNTVDEISTQFDLYWNSIYAVPAEWLTEIKESYTEYDVDAWIQRFDLEAKFNGGIYDFSQLPLYKKFVAGELTFYWSEATLLYDLPDKLDSKATTLIDDLGAIIQETEKSLVIISPYFVPTKEGTKQLVDAVKSGIEVIIVTNSLASNDVFAVHGWYAKYRTDLVRGGVKLWEVKHHAEIKRNWSWTGSSRSSLHTKALIIDKRKVFVGSMNWDPRSAYLNTELGVLVRHPEFAKESHIGVLEEVRKNSYELKLENDKLVWFDHVNQETLTSEPDASIWRRMGAWFSGILPIEDHL